MWCGVGQESGEPRLELCDNHTKFTKGLVLIPNISSHCVI